MESSRLFSLELDTTQKEVYESADPPLLSQQQQQDQVEQGAASSTNESITSDKLNVAQARSNFRRAEQGVKPQAASESSSSSQMVYEVLAAMGDEAETPLQKYQRLQLEVSQLAQELENKPVKDVEHGVTSQQLREQVSQLEQQLKQLGQPVASAAENPSSVTSRLVQQLHRLLNEQAGKPAAPKAAATAAALGNVSSSDQIVYELFYSSDLAKSVLDQHLVQLDSRVTALEKAVGNTSATHLAAGNLAATVAAFGTKLALFDPKQIDSLATRVKLLLPELEKVTHLQQQQKKGSSVDSDTDSKINTLFQKLDQFDPLVHTLPTLVDRLRSLQHVHQSAIGLVDTVQAIAKAQGHLSEQLKTHEALLAKVESGIATNTATVQKNIDLLDKRVTDLLSKVQTLSTKK